MLDRAPFGRCWSCLLYTSREDGVKSHLKKAGTPTMGGVIILLSIVITSVFYLKDYPKIIPILFVTLGFGLIGFLDDYLKVVMKRSDGLFPKQKMALQIVVTAIFAFYLVKFTDVSLKMLIPFSGGKYLDLGWFAIVLLFIAVIGTVNGCLLYTSSYSSITIRKIQKDC